MLQELVITLPLRYDREMEDLREFYDPDTVDLMQWLQQNTSPSAVITGSMQLMAVVSELVGRGLCSLLSGRPQVL